MFNLFDKKQKLINNKLILISHHKQNIAQISMYFGPYFAPIIQRNYFDIDAHIEITNLSNDTLFFNFQNPNIVFASDSLHIDSICNMTYHKPINTKKIDGLYIDNVSFILPNDTVIIRKLIYFGYKQKKHKKNILKENIFSFFVQNLYYQKEEIKSDTFYYKQHF